MYGNLDYQLMQEIARIAQQRGETMDPMLNSLAHKLQQERLEEAARHRANPPGQSASPLNRLGALLVTLGQKLQATPEENSYPSLDNEACA